LEKATSGAIRFNGADLTQLKTRERAKLSTDIQVVFQDPYSSMNPTLTVGVSLMEPLGRAEGMTKPAARQRMQEMLERVGLPASAANRYPSAFSGGQRQRLAIARALIGSPKLVVCDEAVSALDLCVQAQILNLLAELQQQMGVAYLFIGHDLDVVRHLASRMLVLYGGQVMEAGPAEQVYSAPQHPYTQALVAAAPAADPSIPKVWSDGVTPAYSPARTACHFAGRCPHVMDRCRVERPDPHSVPPGSLVACHLFNEERGGN
jgi:peptide/nickel transport system ATP-binding protein